MSLSVIIPSIGNRPDFILEAINSVLSQKHRANELIIVMSGENQIDLPHWNDTSIRVIRHLELLPVSNARNLGAAQASSDYLAFLDDDDLWDENYLFHMISHLRKNSLDCVIARLHLKTNTNLVPLKPTNSVPSIKDLFHHNPGVTGSNVILHKRIFFEVGGFNTKLSVSQDKALVIDLIKSGYKIGWENKAIAIHRIHNGPRLSHDRNLINGLVEFLDVYATEMSRSEVLWVKRRISSLKYANEPNLLNLINRLVSIGIHISSRG
jgi:glycosyltransferase involved in cell wall biosynthesis